MKTTNTETRLADGGLDEKIVNRDPESAQKESAAYAREIKMTPWLLGLLLVFAVLKEFKTGEPFVFKYQTEVLNITSEELTGEVYMISAYTCALLTVPVFLLADLLLSKPFIYAECLGQLGYRVMLVFCSGIFSQQVGEVMFGLGTASEIVYFSYTYYIVDKENYRKLTGWTRAGTMAGRTIGALLAQLIILTGMGSYWTLNLIAFCIACAVLVLCFFLPRISWKQLAFNIHLKEESKEPLPRSYREFALARLRKIKHDFLTVFSIGPIVKWSFWSAITTCMNFQIALYYLVLFGEVQVGDDHPTNAFADAAYTLISTFAIIGFNKLPIDWDRWSEVVLVVISSIDAGLLYWFARAESIYPMYFCYIAYRVLYMIMITIAQWNIAKAMVGDSFNLVFGVNLFIAFLLQSLMVRVVVSNAGLGLGIRDVFLVFAYTHVVIAVVFLVSVVYGTTHYLLRRAPSKVGEPKCGETEHK